jgi:hypothetical protein
MAEVTVTGAPASAPAGDEGGVDVPVNIEAIAAKHAAAIYKSAPAAPEAPAAVPAPAAAPAAPAPETPAAPAAQPTALAQAAAQAAATAVTPPAPTADEPTLRARQLAALSRMEEEARATKAAYEARLKELEQIPREPQAPSNLDDFRDMFLADPDAALAALGIDDRNTVAVQLMHKQLGADLPPELQNKIAQRRTEAELAAIKRKLEKREQDGQSAHQTAAYHARVEATDRELQSFTKSVPADMRFLAAEARENPDAVYQGLCTVAASHIKAGKFPSAREVAKALEDQLAADFARLSRAVGQAPTTPASQPAPTPPQPSTMGTLSDADTRGRLAGDEPSAEQVADPDYWIKRGEAKLRQLGYR